MIERFCIWYLKRIGYHVNFPRRVSHLQQTKYRPCCNEEQIEAEFERVRKYLTQ